MEKNAHEIIQAGSVINQLSAVKAEHQNSGMAEYHSLEYYEEDGTVYQDLHILDRTDRCYTPKPGDKVMVRLDEYTRDDNGRNPDLTNEGFLFLPADQPLPTAEALGLATTDRRTQFQFFGFVTEGGSPGCPQRFIGAAPTTVAQRPLHCRRACRESTGICALP